MKSETKWGMPNHRSWPIFCPDCKAGFVNRKKRACPDCGVKLYVGAEPLFDRSGYWWNPKDLSWISVGEIYKV